MGVELDVSVLTEGGSGDNHILRRTPQTHPDVMVIRIDNGRAAREVGPDGNPILRELKQPWLGIVAVGCQGGTAHQFRR